MKKNASPFLLLIGVLAFSLTAGAQQGARRGAGAPIKALGPGPKGPVVDQGVGLVQAPTNTSLG